jgi:quercetin dioxygenase-like cupin family protein
MSVKVLRPEKDFVLIPYVKEGTAKAIIWPGMGAKYGVMNYFVMKPGGENVPHKHDDSEDMFYIAQGQGVVADLDNNIEHPIEAGCFVYVEPGTMHAAKSYGPDDYISIGGPTPPDPEMFKELLKK